MDSVVDSDLSAVGGGVVADTAGSHGITSRQRYLRQISRITRVFRCKHFHQSLRKRSFRNAKFVDHVDRDARQRNGCEYPTDFDGPGRISVILRIQWDRIDQSTDEN